MQALLRVQTHYSDSDSSGAMHVQPNGLQVTGHSQSEDWGSFIQRKIN